MNTFLSLATLGAEAAEKQSISDLGVVGMGIGIVFTGLVCLVFICWLLGKIVSSISSKEEQTEAAAKAEPVSDVIPNREEMIAAVSAVVAEELGKDISAIRVVSFKKL